MRKDTHRVKSQKYLKRVNWFISFAPSVVSLQTNTKKCHADFVGPLVLNRVLDETHYILSGLEECVLCGVYHARRLKKAQLRTPVGNVTMYDELKSTFQDSNMSYKIPCPVLQMLHQHKVCSS